MPRKSINQISEFPYHITGRVSNKSAFPIPLDQVWDILQKDLYFMNKLYGLQIISFVLMPNHFHLMASVKEVPIGTIMAHWMPMTTKEINFRADRINQLWGTRHHKTELNSYVYLMNCYKYVYQNPVRAGLSERAEDWPYSTLNGLLGKSHLFIPLAEDPHLIPLGLDVQALDWINQRISDEDLEALRFTFSFKTPRPPRLADRRTSHRLSREIL